MTLPERGNVQRLPIPQNLEPDYICMKLMLPDDPEYIQAFVGKIRELGLWTNYDRDALKNGRIVAGIWKYVETTLKLCTPDCGCDDDDNDCGDCGDCGKMAKSGVRSIRLLEAEQAYEVTYCDDTIDLLPIPCTCGDGVTNPPIPENGMTRCRKLGFMAHGMNEFFSDFLAAVCPYVFTPTDPLLSGAIMVWMANYDINPILYPAIFAYTTLQLPSWAADACSLIGTYETIDLPVANIMDCCWNESQVIDAAFISCIRENMNGGAVFEDQGSGTQNYLRALSVFIGIFNADFWFDFFWDKLSTTSTTDYVDCESFIECGGQLGCVPEALYQTTVFKWDNVLLVGGADDCYGSGVYTACTPFNSRLVSDEISVDFPEPVCFKELLFSFAGNGQVNWLDVEYLIDDAVVGSSLNVIGKTRCGDSGLGWSGGINFTTPIAGNKITIRPTRTTGSNPSYGVNVHCVQLNYAYI